LRRLRLLVRTAMIVWCLGTVSVAAAHMVSDSASTGHCTLFASPAGSDVTGDGNLVNPYQTLVKLDTSLSPGETGCLLAGTYGGTSTWHELSASGSSAAPITIRSAPGQTATIAGYVELVGSYTTLEDVRIDGSNTLYRSHPAGIDCRGDVSNPLVIAGHNDILQYDNYYQSIPSLRGVGIGIGFWGDADNTIIRHDKIHDVGQCLAYDHLIYLSHGNNVKIYDNWLWNDTHGRGILLYPAPTNARIWGNVIDHTGVGFGIGNEAGETVSGNKIFDNIVMGSTGLPSEHLPGTAISVVWGGEPGTGNQFTGNDAFHDPGGIGVHTDVTTAHNTTRRPHFANAAKHDFAAKP
jgi:hypothetical protein